MAMKRGMTNYERIFQDLGELKSTTVAILEQTKKTNGRVSALEMKMETVEVKIARDDGEKKGIKLSRERLFAIISLAIAIITLYIRFK